MIIWKFDTNTAGIFYPYSGHTDSDGTGRHGFSIEAVVPEYIKKNTQHNYIRPELKLHEMAIFE